MTSNQYLALDVCSIGRVVVVVVVVVPVIINLYANDLSKHSLILLMITIHRESMAVLRHSIIWFLKAINGCFTGSYP